MRTSFPIRITSACLLVTMAACTTWQPYQLEGSSELPQRVRVNLITSESVELGSPYVAGDTVLVGVQRNGVFRRVALRDVVSLEVGHTSGGRTTVLLLGLGTAAALFALVYVECAGSDRVC